MFEGQRDSGDAGASPKPEQPELRAALEICHALEQPAAIFWGPAQELFPNELFRVLAQAMRDGGEDLLSTRLVPLAREALVKKEPRVLRELALEGHAVRRAFRATLTPIASGWGVFVVLAEHSEYELAMSMVAHDLKNPLNVVSLSVYQLMTLPLPPDMKERVKKQGEAIKRSTQRITDLLNDVLDLARLEVGELSLETELQPAERIVDEAIEHLPALVSQKKITIQRSVEPGLQVACDRERTARVLSGILLNAVTASPEEASVLLRVWSDGRQATFEVRDFGPGIPESDAEHLFDRYLYKRRATKPRLGRGLPLAKGVIEAQRGRIWFESERDRGTAFFFSLPIAQIPK